MIRRKVDYYHFYIDLSLETNGLQKRANSQIMTE